MKTYHSNYGIPITEYDNEHLHFEVDFDIPKDKVENFVNKEIPKLLKKFNSFTKEPERKTTMSVSDGKGPGAKVLFRNYQTFNEQYIQALQQQSKAIAEGGNDSANTPMGRVRFGKNKPV